MTQAKKGGFLSGVIAADRALSILVSGDSNDFTVRIGIGKWLEHLGVAALETVLLSELFLIVEVAEMAFDRRPLGVADHLAAFPVGVRALVCERENDACRKASAADPIFSQPRSGQAGVGLQGREGEGATAATCKAPFGRRPSAGRRSGR